MQQLIEVRLVDSAYLDCRFRDWLYPEDIDNVLALLVNSRSQLTIKERINGADRYAIRCQFQQAILVIHIDLCAQSVWIDAEQTADRGILEQLQLNIEALVEK